MKRNLVSLLVSVTIFAGCSSNYDAIKLKDPSQEYRHPLESEFRPGQLPYHEKFRDPIEEDSKPKEKIEQEKKIKRNYA